MVAAMIARRKPIVAAIVSLSLVSFGSAVVMARGDMAARTAVGVATACSRSTAATGVVASATGVIASASASASASAFCNECQKARTRMELIRSSTRDGGPGR